MSIEAGTGKVVMELYIRRLSLIVHRIPQLRGVFFFFFFAYDKGSAPTKNTINSTIIEVHQKFESYRDVCGTTPYGAAIIVSYTIVKYESVSLQLSWRPPENLFEFLEKCLKVDCR